ncbi:MAG: hypothetical protein QME75_10505 [Deltaproteobacteria bacterium]|nr:hypothetical protein [Deltaproteobacteria bacterium]
MRCKEVRLVKVWNEEGQREQRELPPQRICAWCGCRLPDRGRPELPPGKVSHGICQPCVGENFKDLEG